ALHCLLRDGREVSSRDPEIAKSLREPKASDEHPRRLADLLAEGGIAEAPAFDAEDRGQASIRCRRDRDVESHRVRKDDPIQDAMRSDVAPAEDVAQPVVDTHARLREDQPGLHGALEHALTVVDISRTLNRLREKLK